MSWNRGKGVQNTCRVVLSLSSFLYIFSTPRSLSQSVKCSSSLSSRRSRTTRDRAAGLPAPHPHLCHHRNGVWQTATRRRGQKAQLIRTSPPPFVRSLLLLIIQIQHMHNLAYDVESKAVRNAAAPPITSVSAHHVLPQCRSPYEPSPRCRPWRISSSPLRIHLRGGGYVI